nr:uncharacterized protein LOC109189876 [Ipomoea batatas]GME19613.1 uncharacterized protein LOC109189876 [Ipomoea batatas]
MCGLSLGFWGLNLLSKSSGEQDSAGVGCSEASMGLIGTLSMLLFPLCFFLLPQLCSTQLSGSSLDSLLQDYAYRGLVSPRTGAVYDGNVPSNLTGIKVSAVRFRSGSLRARGVIYKEFEIPVGFIARPYVERLVLVYQNLGNWSMKYYPLHGYAYLTPVIGLLAYNASNLSAKNLSELNIMVSGKPISIRFSDIKSIPSGFAPKCVSFDLQGSVNFSNVSSENRCTTFQQGHFAIVIESPLPVTPLPPSNDKGKMSSKTIWIIVGTVGGGLAVLVLLGFLVAWLHKYKRQKKMQHMEMAAEVGEVLKMTTVGSTKAPAASVTRTQPTLESQYAL